MKKFLFSLAAIAVMVCTALSLAACSSNDDDNNDDVDESMIVYEYYVEESVSHSGNFTAMKAQVLADVVSTMKSLGCEQMSSTDDSGKFSIKASGSSFDESVAKALYNTYAHDTTIDTSKFSGTIHMFVVRVMTNGTPTSTQVYENTFSGTMDE